MSAHAIDIRIERKRKKGREKRGDMEEKEENSARKEKKIVFFLICS